MTVRLSAGGSIVLAGACPSEDAEVLLQLLLLTQPDAVVDWTECESAHAAVIQLLRVARRPLRGSPSGAALRKWIAPVFAAPTR